jgi:hypothetical protein
MLDKPDGQLLPDQSSEAYSIETGIETEFGTEWAVHKLVVFGMYRQ